VRRAAKIDDNQPAIVEALKRVGVAVEYIKKPVDLLVCHRGETALVEVKNPDGGDRLTKDQIEFIARWPGKIHVVRSVEEALEAVLGKEHVG
jgi:hypothetical protein